MFDKEKAAGVLININDAAETIIKRTSGVNSPADFLNDEEGRKTFDSVCMLIIAIGEALKNLDKITGHTYLSTYTDINWKNAKGMRDIISHQYFDIDEEIVFDVCKNHIPGLSAVIKKMIEDL